MKKKIGFAILAILGVVAVIFGDMVAYGLSQAKGQLTVVWNARPIEDWLAEGNLSDDEIYKLQLIQEIRRFAFDSLGIKESENYTKLYYEGDETTLWVITACEPFAFKSKEWKFPLLGTFSYKGYFDKEKAKAELEELKAGGWDVSGRAVSGWSTLGWFKDPVLSSMLRRKEGDLANLIIHELSHGSIFIKDDTDQNENVATFIGDKGAELFLIQKFGADSEELKQYLNSKDDYRRFAEYWLEASIELEQFYAELDTSNVERAKKLKEEKISELVEGLKEVPFHNEEVYHDYFADLPNNTFIMNFRRYRSKQNIFQEEFEMDFEQNLKNYIAHLIKKHG
ncbi:aminopeptidase [Fulvivirgaceae bacterium LMO-SS25]